MLAGTAAATPTKAAPPTQGQGQKRKAETPVKTEEATAGGQEKGFFAKKNAAKKAKKGSVKTGKNFKKNHTGKKA
jgi:hypothetical protein